MRRMDFDKALFRGTPDRLQEVLVEQWRLTPSIHTVKGMLGIVPRARQDQALAILEEAIPDAHLAMEKLRAAHRPKERPTKIPAPQPSFQAKPMDQVAENTRLFVAIKPL